MKQRCFTLSDSSCKRLVSDYRLAYRLGNVYRPSKIMAGDTTSEEPVEKAVARKDRKSMAKGDDP